MRYIYIYDRCTIFEASVNKSVIAADVGSLIRLRCIKCTEIFGLGSKYPVSMFGHRFIFSIMRAYLFMCVCVCVCCTTQPIFSFTHILFFRPLNRRANALCIPKYASCHRECATNKTKEIKIKSPKNFNKQTNKRAPHRLKTHTHTHQKISNQRYKTSRKKTPTTN